MYVKLVTYKASFTDSHPAILGPHSSNLYQWRFASIGLEALIEILVHNRMLLRKLLIFRHAEQVLLTGQQINLVHLPTTETLTKGIESTYYRLPSQLNKYFILIQSELHFVDVQTQCKYQYIFINPLMPGNFWQQWIIMLDFFYIFNLDTNLTTVIAPIYSKRHLPRTCLFFHQHCILRHFSSGMCTDPNFETTKQMNFCCFTFSLQYWRIYFMR